MPTTPSRRTLHVVASDSARGSLRGALRSAGRDEDVLAFGDDLSCGPIDPEDPDLREGWWSFGEEGFMRDAIRAFWAGVDAGEARIVLWFGRHAAWELSFFHHWADRLGDRPYEVVDVTGRRPAYHDDDGQPAVAGPLASVVTTPTAALPALFGTERPLAADERARAREHWRRLKAENAPFRVVTDGGLASAPADHFDASLLLGAGRDWRKSARLVGECMSRNWRPYIQVGDLMLARRLEALVASGRLLARGDVSVLWASEVRLPD